MNKFKFIMFLMIVPLLVLTGCQINTDTSTTYNVGDHVENKENYIDYTVLDAMHEEETSLEFDIYTLEYGRFSTAMAPISLSVSSMASPKPIKAEFKAGEMEFVSQNVYRFQKIHKGDVIAKVRMEIDDIDLYELEVKLLRLEEAYDKALEAHNLSQEELKNQYVYSENQSKLRNLKYEKAEIQFSRTNENYKKQIEELKKEITELKKNKNITNIIAPEDGYIMSINYLKAGDAIKNGQTLATYITEDQVCLEFTDNLMHYGYGMTYNLSLFVDRKAMIGTADVVSISGKQLTASWNRQISKVKTDVSVDNLLKGQNITATGETNVMNNVLLIPSNAVIKDGEYTYVVVLREDGKLEKRSFLAGGSNSQYYWVYDGLTEGTKVIIEH